MRVERYLGAVIASFLFPGFGQGLVRQRTAMLVLAVADVGVFGLALWSVWLLVVGLALRLGSAIDAARRMRQPQLAWNRELPAVAVVLGAIGLGYVQLETAAFKVPSSSMYPTIEIGDHVFIDKLALHAPRRGELITFHHPCEGDRVYLKRVIGVAGDTIEIRCNVLYVNGAAARDTLIEGDGCSYDDGDDMGRSVARTCSRYRQTLDDVEFDTFHDADRPGRDQLATAGDVHDFPRLDGLRRPPSCATQIDGEPMQGIAQLPGTIVETPATTACAPQLHYVVPARSLFTLGDNRANSNDSRYWGAVPLANVIGRVVGRWWPAGRFGGVR